MLRRPTTWIIPTGKGQFRTFFRCFGKLHRIPDLTGNEFVMA
jgi:hypothetical protein